MYKGRLLVLLLSGFFLAGCTNQPGQLKSIQSSVINPRGVKTKPPSGFSDTVRVDAPAAVFFNPGSAQLQEISEVTDTAIFESMVHDCFYQQRNAKAVIKMYYPRIRIIEPHFTRYLLYVKKNGTTEVIDLDKKNDPCGVILFDGVKPARLTDMTNIDTDLGFYFRKPI